MNKLKTVLAALLLGCSIYAHDSDAVLLIDNGTDRVEWRVGESVNSINEFTDYFAVVACGPELAWVYENFPTIPMRTFGDASTARKRTGLSVTEMPAEDQCVFWHGDIARFIANNLDLSTSW